MSCGNCTNCANKCDVCINCDSGDYKHCDTQQTFCTGSRMSGQLASAYIGAADAPTFVRDDIIIKKMPRVEVYRWEYYISQAGNYTGERPSFQSPGGQNWSVDTTTDFVYADFINHIIKGIKSIGGPNPTPPEKKRDDIIYADFFNQITNALNNLKLNALACESCISACNVTCNTCNTCDSCISCNTCQSVSSYSSHYSSHYSSR